MIALLEGKLAFKSASKVIIAAGGVGFEVLCTTQALQLAGEIGSPILLHIDTAVREDAITLYGFATAEERDLFRKLIAVHGIGAATGLAILSTYTPGEVVRAILAGDTKALAKVPGIGPKTAQRLALELKDRLGNLALPAETAANMAVTFKTIPGSVFEDVEAGLINLGYKASEVAKIVDKLQKAYPEETDLPKLLKLALRQLTR